MSFSNWYWNLHTYTGNRLWYILMIDNMVLNCNWDNQTWLKQCWCFFSVHLKRFYRPKCLVENCFYATAKKYSSILLPLQGYLSPEKPYSCCSSVTLCSLPLYSYIDVCNLVLHFPSVSCLFPGILSSHTQAQHNSLPHSQTVLQRKTRCSYHRREWSTCSYTNWVVLK